MLAAPAVVAPAFLSRFPTRLSRSASPPTSSASTSRHLSTRGWSPKTVPLTRSSATSSSPLGVEEQGHAAPGVEFGDRGQRDAARVRLDEPGKFGRHDLGTPGQRMGDLLPDPLGLGQFQVPPGVVAAPATAQRDTACGQPQVRGVKVDRDELVTPGARHLLAAAHARKPGDLEIHGNVELVLDLDRHQCPSIRSSVIGR